MKGSWLTFVWVSDLFQLFFAQFVLSFLRFQEAAELFLLLALNVLLEFLLIVGKSLGLEYRTAINLMTGR